MGKDSENDIINNLVENESVLHGDVLIHDFHEHYNNLTIKTVMLLKYVWHMDHFPTFIFKVKTMVYFILKAVSFKNELEKSFPQKFADHCPQQKFVHQIF